MDSVITEYYHLHVKISERSSMILDVQIQISWDFAYFGRFPQFPSLLPVCSVSQSLSSLSLVFRVAGKFVKAVSSFFCWSCCWTKQLQLTEYLRTCWEAWPHASSTSSRLVPELSPWWSGLFWQRQRPLRHRALTGSASWTAGVCPSETKRLWVTSQSDEAFFTLPVQ